MDLLFVNTPYFFPYRAQDSSRAGFAAWPFMSVHMWGESPLGVWQLEVYNEGRYMGENAPNKICKWKNYWLGNVIM